jgi:hypothetical protein
MRRNGEMARFEYTITTHPANTFRQLIYFCSETGECDLDEVPTDQLSTLADILNERGQEGWELLQIAFGNDGVLAFWKRELNP